MSGRQATPGTEEGWQVIDAAVRIALSRLGESLISAYAIGSLAHGGFASAVSDVDLALLTDPQPDGHMPALAARIAAEVRAQGLALGGRLSLFHTPWISFTDPPPDARFPPIDRDDLVRYGILVHGRDLRAQHGSRATAREIREQAVDSALRRVTPEQIHADLSELETAGVNVHDATKAVLWPVRLQHVCDTGEATGNAAAVDHYVALSDAHHRSLVRDALSWRSLPQIPNPHETLRRITDEIESLHAEVLTRLSQDPEIPRRLEIARLAESLTAHRGRE